MFKSSFRNDRQTAPTLKKRIGGFSLIEILMVLVIIGILSAISLPYLFQYRKLYRTEDQSLKIMYLMREASQMATTKRRPILFEIDLDANEVRISPANGAPDILLKTIPLDPINEVRMDIMPDGVTMMGLQGYNAADYPIATETWTAIFQSNGTVLNLGGLPVSSTFFLWPPVQTAGTTAPRSLNEVRAITIFGGTGDVRYWKFMNTGAGYQFNPYE